MEERQSRRHERQGEGSRRKRLSSLEDTLGSPVYSAEPEPPYQSIMRDMLWLVFRIDPLAVQPFLPTPIKLAPTHTGVVCIYGATAGWGLGQYCRGFLGVAVEGYASPDTGEPVFILGDVATASAATLMRPRYGSGMLDATISTERSNGVASASAAVNGVPLLEVSVRLTGEPDTSASGIDRYLSIVDGHLVIHDVAFAAEGAMADLIELTIGDDAPAAWRAARPVEHLFSLSTPRLVCSIGAPQRADADLSLVAAHLRLLEAEGRAALLFDAQMKVVVANRLVTTDLKRCCAALGEDARFADAFRGLGDSPGRSTAGPLGLAREGDGLPILLTLVALKLSDADGSHVLGMLVDPEATARHDATSLLRLMGLTQAEARLASVMGLGLSARDAAAALEITASTARSTLRLVYDKLGISKQSELGNLVARLQFV